MAIQPKIKEDRWGKSQADIKDELLKENGITKYATFGVTGEGEYLPSGLEVTSWSMMTPDAKVQDIWLAWDETKQAPDGTIGYYRLDLKPIWSEQSHAANEKNPYYIRAKKELGISLTTNQEKILKDWEGEQKKYQT